MKKNALQYIDTLIADLMINQTDYKRTLRQTHRSELHPVIQTKSTKLKSMIGFLSVVRTRIKKDFDIKNPSWDLLSVTLLHPYMNKISFNIVYDIGNTLWAINILKNVDNIIMNRGKINLTTNIKELYNIPLTSLYDNKIIQKKLIADKILNEKIILEKYIKNNDKRMICIAETRLNILQEIFEL